MLSISRNAKRAPANVGNNAAAIDQPASRLKDFIAYTADVLFPRDRPAFNEREYTLYLHKVYICVGVVVLTEGLVKVERYRGQL